MRVKIRLDTAKDALDFVNITSRYPDNKIIITDGKGMQVSAKSMLGMLYALEFDEIWCESDVDLYRPLDKYIIIDK